MARTTPGTGIPVPESPDPRTITADLWASFSKVGTLLTQQGGESAAALSEAAEAFAYAKSIEPTTPVVESIEPPPRKDVLWYDLLAETEPPTPGPSAYEIAVDEGFAGTEAQWLESIRGERGPVGPYGGTEVTDPQVASYIGRAAGTATTAALDQAYRRGFSVKEWGAKGDGTTDDTIAIQAAADAVASYGVDAVLYFPEGVYRTSETLILSCSLDASAATISYSGTGIAVDLGDSRASGLVTLRKSMRAPRVVLATKSGNGWPTGTTGIRLVNLSACDLYLPQVKNFETGILGYGYSQGTVYNSVTLGAMENNRVNMCLDANETGWVNQNVFIGGRFQHFSNEGASVAGARHLQINSPANPVNNNLFLNPSFEGDTPEFHLDIAGTANLILNGRYEVTGGARVRWQSAATQNQIMYGYQSVSIVETWEPGAHPSNNLIAGQGGHTATAHPAVVEHTSSPAGAVEVILASGTLVSEADPETAYTVRRSANDTRMKRRADQYDRILIDHVNGKILMGNGVAAPGIEIGSAADALYFKSRTQTTAPAAGSAAALPATPAGYMHAFIDGARRYIPYY